MLFVLPPHYHFSKTRGEVVDNFSAVDAKFVAVVANLDGSALPHRGFENGAHGRVRLYGDGGPSFFRRFALIADVGHTPAKFLDEALDVVALFDVNDLVFPHLVAGDVALGTHERALIRSEVARTALSSHQVVDLQHPFVANDLELGPMGELAAAIDDRAAAILEPQKRFERDDGAQLVSFRVQGLHL